MSKIPIKRMSAFIRIYFGVEPYAKNVVNDLKVSL